MISSPTEDTHKEDDVEDLEDDAEEEMLVM